MIHQRIPDQSFPSNKTTNIFYNESSSEDSVEISPNHLRLGGIKKQNSVGKMFPNYSKDSINLYHNGSLNTGNDKLTASFIRPKKSDLMQANEDYQNYDTGKYAERENFPNQENIETADKSNKSSPNLPGNKKLKRFESNAKMTFETQIQKAKYTSSIAVGSMLKEMKQNDHERRSSEPRFSSGENYLNTEVDDDLRKVSSNEASALFHMESTTVVPTTYRSQPNDQKRSESGPAVNIDEEEVEWLQSKTGISRDQAITFHFRKNKDAPQSVATSQSDAVVLPAYDNNGIENRLKTAKKEVSPLSTVEKILDDTVKIPSSTASSRTRSTLERIFGALAESESTEEYSFMNISNSNPKLPGNKYADRDIRVREPLSTKSLAMLKTASASSGSYSTARISGNIFNVEAETQLNETNSLSSSVMNNDNLSTGDMIDDKRQEFYETFDKQVNLLMKKGLSREEAFRIQMQLQSQNVDPNVTQSVDEEQRYYIGMNENIHSVFEDPRQRELDKLMEYGMTGEQAELFLQRLSSPPNTAPTQPPQQSLVTKVAVRPIQQLELPSADVDEDEPFDEYQQKVKKFMQTGYTQEQAELAISMQVQRHDRPPVDTRRQDAPNHQGNKSMSSNAAHLNGNISLQSTQAPLTDGSGTLDANDEAEIAVLVARGFTRAEAIISIMAADEAEAFEIRSSSNVQSLNQNLSPNILSYASSTLPVETEIPIAPMRHSAVNPTGNHGRFPYMPPHQAPVPAPTQFTSYDDFDSYPRLDSRVSTTSRMLLPQPLHSQLPYAPPLPAHLPVPPPSINIGTYFKAENPDDEALELGILLSHQEALFGENMFEALRTEDSVAVDSYIASGFTFNDAVLDVFERRNGVSRPAPRQQQRQVHNGYPTQGLYTYPGRGHNANQIYPTSNNSVYFPSEPSSHRRHTTNSIYFADNPLLPSDDRFFPPNSAYGRTLSSSSSVTSLPNQYHANRYLPARNQFTFSGSTVATAPISRNANRRTPFVGTSSASSVPGEYLRNNRSNLAHVNHGRNSALDVAPPFIQPYPPPESALDTHWRKGFKVENCKKSAVKRLMRMGFREEEAVQALLETGQNEKHAAQLLYANRAHYLMF